MMTENDIKSMGLVLSLDECIKITQNMYEQGKDKLKYARSRASKNSYKKSIEFWGALQYHLERLKQMEPEIKK